MANINGYTGISIKESSKEKLDSLKGENDTYEDVINRLLVSEEGSIKKDIVEIKHHKIAFNLEHQGFTKEGFESESHERNISYLELADVEVGDVFEPLRTDDEYYIHEKAEVLFKDDKSLFIRVTVEINREKGYFEEYELLHVHLF